MIGFQMPGFGEWIMIAILMMIVLVVPVVILLVLYLTLRRKNHPAFPVIPPADARSSEQSHP